VLSACNKNTYSEQNTFKRTINGLDFKYIEL
jgi:hypothetical protein